MSCRGLAFLFFSLTLNAAPPELIELRQQTKNLLMQKHCFNCHSIEGKRSIERAMKVYNLDKENWYSSMSERQLVDFRRRIFDKPTPAELKEMGGLPNEQPLDKKQKELVSRFIDLEIENRRTNPFEQVLGK